MRPLVVFSRRARHFAAIVGTCVFLAACGAEGLAVGNLVRSDGGVSFKLANDSTDTGDVVMWIEQDDIVSCERIVRVEARHTYDITFGCKLSSSRFNLRFAWASMMRERALVARRIE